MARKKPEEMQEPVADVAEQAAPPEAAPVEKGSFSSEEIEAIKQQAKDEAFDEMCKAMGQDPAKMRAEAASKASHEGESYEVDLGVHEVFINGHPYSGVVKGNYALVEQLASMAGAKRNRILNEKIGNQGVVDMLNSGIRTRHVGTIQE
jgi:hypothetical protein